MARQTVQELIDELMTVEDKSTAIILYTNEVAIEKIVVQRRDDKNDQMEGYTVLDYVEDWWWI